MKRINSTAVLVLVTLGATLSFASSRAPFQSVGAKAAEKKFTNAIDDLDSEYRRRKSELRRGYIRDLDKALAQAMRTQDLDEANLINVELDAARTALEDDQALPMTTRVRQLVGQWDFKWLTSGNKEVIEVDAGGRVKDKALVLRDGRVFCVSYATEHIEFILHDDRLIVLGWSKRFNLNPFKDMPNHMGIATRLD